MDVVERLLDGDRRALARAISLVEMGDPSSRVALRQVYPHTGRAQIVGVTGAPGSGKSTLVSGLAREFRRRGRTVGIIAVDPSSPFTGGALLGDRIRMQELAGDPGIFIRSMASRGHLGGLAQATGDVLKLLDAAGFSLVIVETVGAGQSEVEVAGAAHTTIVVEVPGLGDDIQAGKAGILEIADILVVNKADLPGADRVISQLEAMLHMGHYEDGWRPPVLRAAAAQNQGLAELADTVEQHWVFMSEEGRLAAFCRRQAEHEFAEALRSEAMRVLRERVLDPTRHAELVERICERELDPYSAASKVLAGLGRAAVAYSGGVDSTLLLAIARQELGRGNVLALTARSALTPAVELQQAEAMAGQLDVEHRILDLAVLEDPEIVANRPDRCYHCKRRVFGRLQEAARGEGFAVLLHGANVDDLGDYRPGQRAAAELGVRAPLLEAGLAKADVRTLSRRLGLSTWDHPAMACLASRIPYHTPLSAAALARVEAAELWLRERAGLPQLRVRDHFPLARIEAEEKDIARLSEPGLRREIVTHLRSLGYHYVALDLAGFRSGSMNEVLRAP